MAVKHTPTGEVHSGKKGGKTGCGFNTNEQSSHWITQTKELLVQRVDVGRNCEAQKYFIWTFFILLSS